MTSELTGNMLIGGREVRGDGGELRGVDPRDGLALEPSYGLGGTAVVADAAAQAAEAFLSFRESAPDERAAFLESIAENIEGLEDGLISTAHRETAIPLQRLAMERDRTTAQLRRFAAVVRRGEWRDIRIDRAMPYREPMPRPDLRMRMVPLGPVAVFGASNFPLAFSVAGGDTASALAAGCPVIVKAHSAHPATSELVGRAIADASGTVDLHPGVFSLLYGEGRQTGVTLVSDPRIAAVGFTGSRQAGKALIAAASDRPVPIPVFAEMSSVNPVVVLPGALAGDTDSLAAGFVSSLTASSGQLCTNPGLIFAVNAPGLDAFVDRTTELLDDVPAAAMLTAGIAASYRSGVQRIFAHEGVVKQVMGSEREADSYADAAPSLFTTDAKTFLASPELSEEVFGASTLVVVAQDVDEITSLLSELDGQLVGTLHAAASDYEAASRLIPLLEEKVGRIVFNGWPTGVEVADAMVHGGPYPSTSDARSTSVGSRAIARFLRPVSYQDVPSELLPQELHDDNPYRVPRMVDGRPTVAPAETAVGGQ